MNGKFALSRRWWASLAALAVTGSAVAVVAVRASDHQDTPEVELSPRMDINDVYAFPGANGTDNSRITLVMTTSSPIVPSGNAGARFDPDLLYQFHIDNSAPLDGVDDLVIQMTFDSTTGNGRVINVRGPVAPPTRMDADGTPLPRGGTAKICIWPPVTFTTIVESVPRPIVEGVTLRSSTVAVPPRGRGVPSASMRVGGATGPRTLITRPLPVVESNVIWMTRSSTPSSGALLSMWNW